VPVTIGRTAGPAPAPLRWAIWLLIIEAVGLGVVGAFLVYEDLTAEATELGAALAVTAFAFAAAAALALLARALWQRRGGARGPAVALQLFLLPIGYYMIQGGVGWLGFPVIVLGLVGCGLLVTPSTTRALGLTDRNRTS
jgi:hypothetical protein